MVPKFLVELFIPLNTPDGIVVPASTLERIKEELTDRFGGVTAFLQSPADGCWKPLSRAVVHDQIAVFEIMTDDADHLWWSSYRKALETELRQEVILARLHQVVLL